MSSDRETTLALYQKLVATRPGIELKGKTSVYTSMNGHMFSFLTKEGALALRLPAAEREAFLERYETELVVQYGTVMKEYVLVPASLLRRASEMAGHFATSVDYIASLKPKPTTRPKKKPAKKTAKSAALPSAAVKNSSPKKR